MIGAGWEVGHGCRHVGLYSRVFTSHCMDRKIQRSPEEELAEGQGTKKKPQYLDLCCVLMYTCMDSIP